MRVFLWGLFLSVYMAMGGCSVNTNQKAISTSAVILSAVDGVYAPIYAAHAEKLLESSESHEAYEEAILPWRAAAGSILEARRLILGYEEKVLAGAEVSLQGLAIVLCDILGSVLRQVGALGVDIPPQVYVGLNVLKGLAGVL